MYKLMHSVRAYKMIFAVLDDSMASRNITKSTVTVTRYDE